MTAADLDAKPITLPPYVWCDSCGAIQRAMIERGVRDVTNKFSDAASVICSRCRLIISTHYAKKA